MKTDSEMEENLRDGNNMDLEYEMSKTDNTNVNRPQAYWEEKSNLQSKSNIKCYPPHQYMTSKYSDENRSKLESKHDEIKMEHSMPDIKFPHFPIRDTQCGNGSGCSRSLTLNEQIDFVKDISFSPEVKAELRAKMESSEEINEGGRKGDEVKFEALKFSSPGKLFYEQMRDLLNSVGRERASSRRMASSIQNSTDPQITSSDSYTHYSDPFANSSSSSFIRKENSFSANSIINHSEKDQNYLSRTNKMLKSRQRVKHYCMCCDKSDFSSMASNKIYEHGWRKRNKLLLENSLKYPFLPRVLEKRPIRPLNTVDGAMAYASETSRENKINLKRTSSKSSNTFNNSSTDFRNTISKLNEITFSRNSINPERIQSNSAGSIGLSHVIVDMYKKEILEDDEISCTTVFPNFFPINYNLINLPEYDFGNEQTKNCNLTSGTYIPIVQPDTILISSDNPEETNMHLNPEKSFKLQDNKHYDCNSETFQKDRKEHKFLNNLSTSLNHENSCSNFMATGRNENSDEFANGNSSLEPKMKTLSVRFSDMNI